MAIYFNTNNPKNLLDQFKKSIDDGKIVTWSYDLDGDFTHSVDQWRNQAWMRPKYDEGKLSFYIIKPKNKNISSVVYAIFHGRLLESFLNHCDSFFSTSEVTAFPKGQDLVT